MKIIFYCQHVLGVGHLFRSLEICKALKQHEVVLISGGPHIDTPIPAHVRAVRLPELQMDSGFKGIFSTDQNLTLDQIKARRQAELFALFKKEKPDIFMIELYPFGRKAFRFELDPLLAALHNQQLAPCMVVCSVRDILVEKEDRQKHEGRVVDTLNRYFDAVLVHADPNLIKIEETFLRYEEINIPVYYTGYIAKRPSEKARQKIRNILNFDNNEPLIVASAGGGSVGKPLLESTLRAFPKYAAGSSANLFVYTGPYISGEDFVHLKSMVSRGVRLEKFNEDFLAYLAAADLSISMGGYNTSMDILASGVSALVWPFALNREQLMRSRRLARRGAFKILTDKDLQPERLAELMTQAISKPHPGKLDIDLDGAAYAARWLEDRFKERGRHR